VESEEGFSVGDTVVITGVPYSPGFTETRDIASFGSIVLDAPLDYGYPAGSSITTLGGSHLSNAPSAEEQNSFDEGSIVVVVGVVVFLLACIALGCLMKRRWPGRGRGPAANRGMPDAEMNAGNDVEIEEGKGVEASRPERVPDPMTPEPNQQVQTCEFWFMPVAAFMALPDDQPLPPQQELRDRGLLVKRSISMKDVVNGSMATDTAAVSHRWDTPSHPDPECFKIKKLKSVLGEMPLIKFLWMDFICAPQWLDGRRTPEEEAEFRNILVNILPYMYLGATVLVLYERIYGQRFWPCVETWVSTKTPTKNGLEPSPQSRQRTHFFGMLSMEGRDQEVTTFMLSIWRKMSTQQAVDTLGKADILVTNEKDKEVNLRVVGELDQMIQMLFEGLDEDVAFDTEMVQLSG